MSFCFISVYTAGWVWKETLPNLIKRAKEEFAFSNLSLSTPQETLRSSRLFCWYIKSRICYIKVAEACIKSSFLQGFSLYLESLSVHEENSWFKPLRYPQVEMLARVHYLALKGLVQSFELENQSPQGCCQPTYTTDSYIMFYYKGFFNQWESLAQGFNRQ